MYFVIKGRKTFDSEGNSCMYRSWLYSGMGFLRVKEKICMLADSLSEQANVN